MKTAVEYKLAMFDDGTVNHPKFISNPGWWYDSENKTYIGIVLPETERVYYVPDTLVEITKDQLVERVLKIHTIIPFVDKSGKTQLTKTEVQELANSWWKDYIQY